MSNFRERDWRFHGILPEDISLGHCTPKNAYLRRPHYPMATKIYSWGWPNGRTGGRVYTLTLETIHQGIVNDVERLYYVVKEHILESTPHLQSWSLHQPKGERERKRITQTLMMTVQMTLRQRSNSQLRIWLCMYMLTLTLVYMETKNSTQLACTWKSSLHFKLALGLAF